MELLDMTTFMTMADLVKKDRPTFIEVNRLWTWKQLRMLMTIHYHIATRGSCYELDVHAYERRLTDVKKTRQINMDLSSMYKTGVIKFLPKNNEDGLGRAIIITERGHGVLDSFLMLFSKHEREFSYQIKDTRANHK